MLKLKENHCQCTCIGVGGPYLTIKGALHREATYEDELW